MKTQTELANFLNIKDGPVSESKRRGVFPLAWAFKIAQFYGLSTDWIMTGEGPVRRDTLVSETKLAYKEGAIPGSFVYVPRYDVKAGAGGGAIVHSERVVDHLAFRREWIKSALGADPARLALIGAAGDSMEPAILNGDLLLIDTAVDRVRDDAIYCIKNEFTLQVKRIQRMIGGDLVVRSDNPAYTEWRVRPDQAGLLEVVGRVVWFGRRI